MDKITYLAELAEGLARWVPERERQDILRYYAEYFDEAGPGKEAEVIAELGDPWALSCRLAVEGGFVTQEAANAWTPRRGRRKMWPFVLAGTLAAVVVVAVSVGLMASRVGRFVGSMVGNRVTAETIAVDEVTFSGGIWSMEDGNLDTFYAIDADISMGNITITAGEDYTLVIQQSGNLGGYGLKWEMQGDTLKIRDGSSGSHNIGLDGLGDVLGQRAVDVIITVPEGSYLQKVTAKTAFGNVYLSELDVEEKVTVKTKMGNVDGYELRTAEKIELKTDMGNVVFGLGEVLYAGMDVELKTNLGDVEVNLECYEDDCTYELKTDLGNVSVNGVNQGSSLKRKGNAVIKLDAESDLGDVAAYFLDSRWR